MNSAESHGGTGNYQNLADVVTWMRAADPRSVLDVGVGFGRWGFLVRDFLEVWNGRNNRAAWAVRLVGVEAFEANIREHQRLLYDELYIGRAEEFFAQRTERFDLCILGDVLEHFPKPVGQHLLEQALARSGYVLLVLPLGGEWPQGDAYGNAFERHLASWEAAEVLALQPLIACEYRDYVGRPFLAALLSQSDPKSLRGTLEPVQARCLTSAPLAAADAAPRTLAPNETQVTPATDLPRMHGATRFVASPNAPLAPVASPAARVAAGDASRGVGAAEAPRLHLALVSYEFSPATGGIATYAAGLVRMLGAAGHHVTVITATAGPHPAFANAEVHAYSKRALAPTGSWSTDWIAELKQFCAWAGRKLDGIHARKPIDVIEVSDYYLEGLFLDAQRWLRRDGSRVPVVTHVHGPRAVVTALDVYGHAPLLAKLEDAWLRSATHRKSYSPLMCETLERMIPGAACALVPAPFEPLTDAAAGAAGQSAMSTSSAIAALGKSAVSVGGSARRASDFAYDILYFGRLQRCKGTTSLVQALQLLAQRGQTPRVCLIGGDTSTADGGGSMAEYVRRELSPLCGERLTLGSAVPRSELAGLLARSRVVIVPSWFESLSFVFLEACAAGRPVIASTQIGATYTLPADLAARSVVNVRNMKAFVERLQSTLALPEGELNAWGAQLREAVLSAYQPADLLEQTVRYYRRCIEVPASAASAAAGAFDSSGSVRGVPLSLLDDVLRILQARKLDFERVSRELRRARAMPTQAAHDTLNAMPPDACRTS